MYIMTKRSRKNIKRRQSHKKRSTQRRKYLGGACGCGKSFFSGGAKMQKGGYGPASWQGFPSTGGSNISYPLNNHIQDPTNPEVIGTARLESSTVPIKPLGNFFGGKRRKTMKRKLRNKRMLGGSNAVTPDIQNNSTAAVSSGVSTLLGSIPGVNPAPYVQPVGNMFTNPHNPMLV